jgi:hypothetical protein
LAERPRPAWRQRPPIATSAPPSTSGRGDQEACRPARIRERVCPGLVAARFPQGLYRGLWWPPVRDGCRARRGQARVPPGAIGEDFLHDYIGNLGVPIELYPDYPSAAHTVLLTEAAASDPQIIAKVEASLRGGANVIVTSGFLEATQDRAFGQLAEWSMTGHTIAVDQYFDGFGAGNGTELREAGKAAPVLFPEVHFYTNDSWGIIRGVAAAKGFPLVLMNHWSNGTLYLWTMPENFGDLYNLPQPMITRIKQYLFADAPVQIDAPDHVALFTYDNGAFIVENFRDDAARVGITRKGQAKAETVSIAPHSFRLFKP